MLTDPISKNHPLLSKAQNALWESFNPFGADDNNEDLNDEKNIYLYGVISSMKFWGNEVSAKDILRALSNIKSDFTLHINSPGGDVFEGAAMMAGLKRFMSETNYEVMISVDGVAASMGSAIASCFEGATVEISEMARYLIHRPMVSLFAADIPLLESAKEFLSKIENDMVGIYSKRSNFSAKEIAAKIEHRDWIMNADEAIKNGFADKIISNKKDEGVPEESARASMIEGFKNMSSGDIAMMMQLQAAAIKTHQTKGEINHA